ELHAAVTNIGRRPSFTCDDLRSETCITDFSGDLYGKNVEVKLLRYIRPERVFDSLDSLGDQIGADAQTAKEIFNSIEK
ncbi:MAG: riboflavin kinase, partial [Clostridiales bacterium]